jgi:methionine-rich copper-binding protein CopC
MPVRRLIPFAALAVLLITLLTAAPALAHTELENSTPAQGASLASAPTAVSLTSVKP